MKAGKKKFLKITNNEFHSCQLLHCFVTTIFNSNFVPYLIAEILQGKDKQLFKYNGKEKKVKVSNYEIEDASSIGSINITFSINTTIKLFITYN